MNDEMKSDIDRILESFGTEGFLQLAEEVALSRHRDDPYGRWDTWANNIRWFREVDHLELWKPETFETKTMQRRMTTHVGLLPEKQRIDKAGHN